jgi:hypothetical protein
MAIYFKVSEGVRLIFLYLMTCKVAFQREYLFDFKFMIRLFPLPRICVQCSILHELGTHLFVICSFGPVCWFDSTSHPSPRLPSRHLFSSHFYHTFIPFNRILSSS